MPLHTAAATQIFTFPDSQALSQGLDKYVSKLSADSIKRHDKFTVAISGGSLPKQLSAVLKYNKSIDFSKWIVYFADERCVPLDHEDSNYLLSKKELFDFVGIPSENIHTINPDLVDDPEEAAEDYISQLAGTFATKDSVRFPVFDLILLGIGPDGHTCSLFPDHPLLEEHTSWCVSIEDSPKPPSRRITLTFPVLNHAHNVAFVAAGEGKQDMLHRILDTTGNLPAQMVKLTTGQLSWFVDDAAAAKVTSTTYKGLERFAEASTSVPIGSTVRIPKRSINQSSDQNDKSGATRKSTDLVTNDKAKPTKADGKAVLSDREISTHVTTVDPAKRRRHEIEPSTSAQINSSKPKSLKASTEAVLLARPQINRTSVPSTTTATKKSEPSSRVTGPPVLKIDLRAHSKPQFRQAVAVQFYNEFVRIYKPIPKIDPGLATEHAMEQEKAVHSKTNQGSYRGIASTVLQRLKKRSVATSETDVGIDGEWVDPSIKSKEDQALASKWRTATKYIQTLDELEANGYPLSIPEGEPLPLERTQICERCQKQFKRLDSLTESEKLACLYHDRQIRTKRDNIGDRVKYHPCCDGLQGSAGCMEGPHVFKEDDILCLHSRIPFIETPKWGKPNKKYHAVVAMDCEMCYTLGGFELIRISVIDQEGKPILDELVKPNNQVLDLNSRFSGITSIENAKYTLEQVRDQLLDLIADDTIIVGQSLENDFKVMRLIHKCVIDTAMLFPHPHRLQNHRYSLQSLARQYLKINIQDTEHGHDSFEDAKTCLDLVLHKIESNK
ncbi:suppressor of los1-1 [Entomortierella beljakovae]|nr:suppressor of los1-1 [Entomortierella beljakovae]